MTNICLVMNCLRPDGKCVPYAAARGTTCKGPGVDKVNVSVSEMLNCVKINILVKRNKNPLGRFRRKRQNICKFRYSRLLRTRNDIGVLILNLKKYIAVLKILTRFVPIYKK